MLEEHDVDVIFSDISMPGLDGIALGRVLARFASPPQLVFVTAHDAARGRRLRPRRDRLRHEAGPQRAPARGRPSRRGQAGRGGYAGRRRAWDPRPLPRDRPGRGGRDDPGRARRGDPLRQPAPRSGGSRRPGDYARLHTADGSHLVRIPWRCSRSVGAEHGFVRIHRSTLVSLAHVTEVRMDHGRCAVAIGDVELQVSRRHTKGPARRAAEATRHGAAAIGGGRPRATSRRGCGSRAHAARREARADRAPRPPTSTSRPSSATSTSTGCVRAQLRLGAQRARAHGPGRRRASR